MYLEEQRMPPQYPTQPMQFPLYLQNCNYFILKFDTGNIQSCRLSLHQILFHLMIYVFQDLKEDLTGKIQADHGALLPENPTCLNILPSSK